MRTDTDKRLRMSMYGVSLPALLFFLSLVIQPAPQAQRPPILGIASISFQVSDFVKARKFYGEVLGFEDPFRLSREDGSLVRTYFKVNDRQFIEVVPGLRTDREDRLEHIAFETGDVEKLRMYLREKGVKVPDAAQSGGDGNLSITVADPDGHLVRFVQYQPESIHMRTRGRYMPSSRISDRLLHVGLTVADTAAADRFYKEILGFSEIWRGGQSESGTDWINMKVPDGTDYLEYMLVSGKVGRERLGVLHHAALLVPDIQKALEAVRQRSAGVENFAVRAPQVGRNNRWQLNLFDPDGSRTELMEPFTMR